MSPFAPRSLGPAEIAKLAFQELRSGVDIHVLHEAPDGARAAILRYAPGAEVPSHRHEGFEYIYVLEGEQSDERGRYGKGSFVVNEPGMTHRVTSQTGCTVLILWHRPVVFLLIQEHFQVPSFSRATTPISRCSETWPKLATDDDNIRRVRPAPTRCPGTPL